MNSIVQYRTLFEIQLLHEYYLTQEVSLFQGMPAGQRDLIAAFQRKHYRVSKDFHIAPTADTRSVMDNYNLYFRPDNFGFLMACRVTARGDGSFIPFSPFDKPFCMRFTMNISNRFIYNFTNLRLEADIGAKDRFLYYFSNRAGNTVNPDRLYLSKHVPEFDPGNTYESGELILDDSNPADPQYLEALENNGPGAFDSSQWQLVLTNQDPLPQFVTRADRIVLRPSGFTHRVESALSENLVILIRDREGSVVRTLTFETSEPGSPLTECEVRLSDLPAACYLLEVRDTVGTVFPDLDLRFYLDDLLYTQRPFALIECFHEPGGALTDYRWFDQDDGNALLTPRYTIHWKNRSTFWRYYFHDAPSFSSAQLSVYEPTPGNPIDRILVSDQPLPLTQFSRQVEIEINGDTYFLPNPVVSSIFPENSRLYSEINMGGGLGPPS